MENKGGFRVVGGPDDKGPETSPELGATGFYYVAGADALDDIAMTSRRSFARLVTLPGYIWRELLKGVVMALAVFSVILMGVFAAQVMRDGIGAVTLLRVMPNFLPLICPFVLPLAIITGIIICYSRLARDNEILASYAGGVHPFWLMFPALMTSIIAIFITLTLNEVALLPAIRNIETLVIDDQANILRRMISRPGSITIPTGGEYFSMTKLDPSRDPSGRSALDITRFALADKNAARSEDDEAQKMIWNPKYPYPAKRVVARDHTIHDFSDNASDELVIKMSVTKPVFQDLDNKDINQSRILDGESGEERIALGGRPSVTIHANRQSFWPILMLTETRREAEDRLRELNASGQNIEDLPEAQRDATRDLIRRLNRVVLSRTADINMRLALCFSCLAFAVLGIPLGMRTRGTIVTSFVTGIATAGLYFLVLKSGEMQVSRGILPYWVIWIPDAIVVVMGLILWRLQSRNG